jgi:hypothetical protein
VSDWILKNKNNKNDLTNIINKTINVPEFKVLVMLRQQFSHGFDFAIKQNKGTIFSDDYFFTSLFRNISNILKLIEYISYDFLPSRIGWLINTS